MTIKIKRHLNTNLKFSLKLANSFNQDMSDKDKQRYCLIFMRS